MNSRLQELLKLWSDRNVSASDKLELMQLIENASVEDEIVPALQSVWENVEDDGAFDESQQEALIRNILNRYPGKEAADASDIDTAKHVIHRVRYLRRWSWAAACLLIVLGIASYWWIQKTPPEKVIAAHEDIQPGKAGAMLTLADGSMISLDSAQNGVVALQGGATASVVDGSLVYEGNGKEVLYNSMSTPKGRQFHMTLPDGSEVWLNAASSIRYPTVFNGPERKVSITGEAYFEVAKITGRTGRKPFKVLVEDQPGSYRNMEIEVLGTHFNVNAYAEEPAVSTTLLEGSILLKKGNEQFLLQPGQQAQFSADEKSDIRTSINAEEVLAWKNGYFVFDNTSLQVVMRQLERWYDVQVEYQGEIPAVKFSGDIPRSATLQQVLNTLQKFKLRFLVEGRKIIVIP